MEQIAYRNQNNELLKLVQMFFAAATSPAATVRTNKNKMTIISQTTKTCPKTQSKLSHSVATHWKINIKTAI